MKQKAKFVLSLDCEFIWGVHYIGGIERYPYLSKRLTDYYDRLLASLEAFDIKATFAFVGAMLLDRQEFIDVGFQNQNPKYRKWISHIANLAKTQPSNWFAPHLPVQVLESNDKHDIGSHSFSHMLFSNSEMDHKTAKFEFNQTHTILKQMGIDAKSFIFPCNHVDQLGAFHQSPFKVYRNTNDTYYSNLPLQRISHLMDQALPIGARPVNITRDSYGNVNLSGSQLLLAYDGIRSLIPNSIRLLKINQGLDKAIKRGGIFHLWFHPWNLASSPRMEKLFSDILKLVNVKRDKGLLEVKTMKELVEHPN